MSKGNAVGMFAGAAGCLGIFGAALGVVVALVGGGALLLLTPAQEPGNQPAAAMEALPAVVVAVEMEPEEAAPAVVEKGAVVTETAPRTPPQRDALPAEPAPRRSAAPEIEDYGDDDFVMDDAVLTVDADADDGGFVEPEVSADDIDALLEDFDPTQFEDLDALDDEEKKKKKKKR